MSTTRAGGRMKIAIVVLATLLVAAVSVLVGLFVLGAVTPVSMGGGSDSREESAVAPGSGIAEDQAYDGADTSGAADMGGKTSDAVADKLVRYASLTLRVDGVAETVEQVRTAARAAGGYIQTSDLYTDGRDWYPAEEDQAAASPTLTGGLLIVRVRDTDLESFVDTVRGLGTVTAESISSQDVTTQYTDLDARIPILEAERDSLTAMLTRATTVEEELMIRDRLVSVTSELRSLVDQREVLADRDTMATVTISLTVPPSALPPSSVEIPWFSWYELQQAVASGVAGFQRIVYVTLTALIATAPIWVPLGIVLLVRRRRRVAAGPQAVTVAPGPDDAEPGSVNPGPRPPSE